MRLIIINRHFRLHTGFKLFSKLRYKLLQTGGKLAIINSALIFRTRFFRITKFELGTSSQF